MTKEKEVGYTIANVFWQNLSWFPHNWKVEDEDTKDLVVEQVGRMAYKLGRCEEDRKATLDSFWAGVFIGALFAAITAISIIGIFFS